MNSSQGRIQYYNNFEQLQAPYWDHMPVGDHQAGNQPLLLNQSVQLHDHAQPIFQNPPTIAGHDLNSSI